MLHGPLTLILMSYPASDQTEPGVVPAALLGRARRLGQVCGAEAAGYVELR